VLGHVPFGPPGRFVHNVLHNLVHSHRWARERPRSARERWC
jgi:hypothetical protein